jgi:hypothetical protein
MLIVVLLHWFRGGGIYGDKYFVILLWVSLGVPYTIFST